jgi:hypothetical protein
VAVPPRRHEVHGRGQHLQRCGVRGGRAQIHGALRVALPCSGIRVAVRVSSCALLLCNAGHLVREPGWPCGGGFGRFECLRVERDRLASGVQVAAGGGSALLVEEAAGDRGLVVHVQALEVGRESGSPHLRAAQRAEALRSALGLAQAVAVALAELEQAFHALGSVRVRPPAAVGARSEAAERRCVSVGGLRVERVRAIGEGSRACAPFVVEILAD